MTNEELDVIEARANAAMAGPWSWKIDDMSGPRANVREPDFADGTPGNRFVFDVMPATAEFIAHAREDIPRLVAEVRRQREVLDFFAGLTRRGLLAKGAIRFAIEALQGVGYTGFRDPDAPLISHIVQSPGGDDQ